ncbi:MAG TPA: LTA synthase family protein [Planctomycetota bacterium]|nr:LTA synthase family protein [Planctomycetota bacterium]
MRFLARVLPRTLALALAVTLLFWAVFAALRLAFWGAFEASEEAPSSDLARALGMGFQFDLRLALLVALPLLLLGWIPALDPSRSRAGRRIWTAYLLGLAGLFALVYACDFGHYDWVHGRIDATIFDHLREAGTALRVGWETYPVVWGLTGVAVFLGGFALAVRRFILRPRTEEAAPLPRPARFAAIALFVTFYAWGLNGTVHAYPLRWSHAFFSPNPFTSALALNPVLYLADTWASAAGERPPDAESVRRHYAEVARLLRVDAPDPERLSFARSLRPADPPGRRPNVVIVFLESFGANKAGVFGQDADLDPTPNFDALARGGLLFRYFFVPSLPTGRSIFSVITGIPDLNPVESASRNPKLVRQRTLINAFEGYAKAYFYTGDLAWANLRGVLAHNVPDLVLHEQKDYASPRNDGWGISDFDLFEEANAVLRTFGDRPFVAFLQTSGNHPPYTIPKDAGAFRVVRADEAALDRDEFRSNEEYNGLRFLDHSLGHFFEIARREAYFESTVFILLGDHASRGLKGDPWEGIGLSSKHVPCVLYCPARFPQGRTIDTVVSSLDVLPTALGLAGLPYTNHTFGRDMLAPRGEGEEFALLRDGLVEPEFLYSAHEGRLFPYRSETPAQDVRERHPEVFDRMRAKFAALHETARYVLHHNRD